MEAIILFLGVLGNITTFLLYLSPIRIFLEIVKNGSTQEFQSLPYVCLLLNASLWTYYGFIKPDAFLVATVNGLGVVVESIYLSLFLLFSSPRMKATTAALVVVVDVGLAAAAVLFTEYEMVGQARVSCVGFLCASFSIISCASPLAAMITVTRTKSVEFMPFLLSFFICINGLTWTIYAIVTQDYFIGVPNGAGFVLGTLQLILYLIYMNPKLSDDAYEPLIL